MYILIVIHTYVLYHTYTYNIIHTYIMYLILPLQRSIGASCVQEQGIEESENTGGIHLTNPICITVYIENAQYIARVYYIEILL